MKQSGKFLYESCINNTHYIRLYLPGVGEKIGDGKNCHM